MTLTVQTILDAAAVLGDAPKVGLYSHRLFFPDRTLTFKAADGEVFHVAAPAFWDRVAAKVSESAALIIEAGNATRFFNRTIWGLRVIDLDANEAERIRVTRAMAEAVPRWEHRLDPTPRHTFPWRHGPDVV